MKKEFRRIFSAAADEIFESDAPFRLFRGPNEIDFPGVRRPKPDDPHPLPLSSSSVSSGRDHSGKRDHFRNSSTNNARFGYCDCLGVDDQRRKSSKFNSTDCGCKRLASSTNHNPLPSECHRLDPCLLTQKPTRNNKVSSPLALDCTKLDNTLSHCCGLRETFVDSSPSTCCPPCLGSARQGTSRLENSGNQRGVQWILGDESISFDLQEGTSGCGRFPVEKSAPCAQFSEDEPGLIGSFSREETVPCISTEAPNRPPKLLRVGRESRSSQLFRMLLPWSNTAEKLASGRQTPATPSPMVTDGATPNGLYQFTDITPGQFGLTKQLVLRITLPHISLLLISIGYALAGCWILTAINYNADSVEAMDLITDTKLQLLKEINSHINNPTYDDFSGNMDESFVKFATGLYKVYSKFPRSTAVLETARGESREVVKGPLTNVTWNLFFVTTTLTSIGYGANAPDSLVGRLFCIIYILFGVPLYLITLADLAKFCTEGMNRTYTEYLKFRHSMKMKYKRWKKRKNQKPEETRDSEESESFDIERVIIAGGETEVAEFLWTHLENTQFVEIPFILIYIILLSYIAAASYLIAYLENWTTQKGFYFVMMSVLTIGFGDVVPSKDKHVLLILFILLLGLIITTTCIDIVGAYYIDQLHFFGRRIDVEDPLLWLKAVQQKRIIAMKREAMRKLFETVAALNRLHFDPASFQKQLTTVDPESAIMKLTEITGEPPNHFRNSLFPEPPPPPSNLKVFNPTAESISLKWDPPVLIEEAKRYWYTLSYKTRTPQRRPNATVIDFVNQTHYEITDLKSFTLYEFSVATTTRYGSSKPVKCQEYTEPCTVPQSLKLDAIGAEKATISWKTPRKNKAQESFVVMFTKDPMPPTTQWTRYRVGRVKRYTFSDLQPETRYICAVTAEHNAGLATMSKTLRFRTKTRNSLMNPQFDQEEDSIAVNMAVEQASHSPTPSLMWRPQPFFAQIQNALQTHFLSSPLRFRFLTETGSRDIVFNDSDDT